MREPPKIFVNKYHDCFGFPRTTWDVWMRKGKKEVCLAQGFRSKRLAVEVAIELAIEHNGVYFDHGYG